MCEVEFDVTATVWNERWRKARKAYVCACCRRAIAVGDRYLSHFSVMDREPTSQRACERCGEIGDAFAREHGGMRYCPSGLAEGIVECLEGDDDADMWLDAYEWIFRKAWESPWDDGDDDEGEAV